MPGPVPKRSDQRRRRNKSSEVDAVPAITRSDPRGVTGGTVVELGFPTHPLAEAWFASLSESGQSQFFEESDWAAARVTAHEMGRMLNAGRVSAQTFTAIWSAMGDLLTTEASRRRVRVEIEKGGASEIDPTIAIMEEYRRAAGN